MSYEKISEDFFNSGLSFEEYLASERMKPEEYKQTKLYYERTAKFFSPEELTITSENPINLVAFVATWCWDCKANLPTIVKISENSPNINLKLFIKEDLPFIPKINGGEKVPQINIYSKDFFLIDRWVERSTKNYQLYSNLRKEYGWEKENFNEFAKAYRGTFLKNQKEYIEAVIDEFRILIERADAIQGATGRIQKPS